MTITDSKEASRSDSVREVPPPRQSDPTREEYSSRVRLTDAERARMYKDDGSLDYEFLRLTLLKEFRSGIEF